jgi:probable phosphoglycerate mutase
MSNPAEIASEFAPTYLYLVRHGQAVVNVEPIIGGMRGDSGLTPLGVRQAECLRDRLASGEVKADILIASTLPRARQTAEIIAPALNLPVTYEPELHELRTGDEADGLPIEEYRRRFGWIDLERQPFQEVDPGGESWATFQLRVGKTLYDITQEYAGKTIVAVCHGGVIDGSFNYFLGLNPLLLPPTGGATSNCSLTLWKHIQYHGRPKWTLARYNDDWHLLNLEPPQNWNLLDIAPASPPENKE